MDALGSHYSCCNLVGYRLGMIFNLNLFAFHSARDSFGNSSCTIWDLCNRSFHSVNVKMRGGLPIVHLLPSFTQCQCSSKHQCSFNFGETLCTCVELESKDFLLYIQYYRYDYRPTSCVFQLQKQSFYNHFVRFKFNYPCPLIFRLLFFTKL